MYAFIEGLVDEKTGTELVLNVNGVGYQVLCTQAAISSLPPKGEFTRVHTWLSVREDAMELFGFHSREERAMFFNLNSISGIGPRTALNILNSMPLKDLTLAILTEDVQMLSRAPGIGKKTAQRIALELKDRLSKDDFTSGLSGMPSGTVSAQVGAVGEAVQALTALGYSQSEAALAVSRAHQGNADLQADELVRQALRSMMKG
ncbi:MAG: Holliday junction branch migration protein RuvA [Clostridiales bacterium]|jgi:Holliday junction DNA helicase RuvA|nr:Holliday junction branch migration protein RuvA [Clostridiales bacterium]